jgi:hypothetical protein
MKCSVILGLRWSRTTTADNSFLSQTSMDGRWYVKRSSLRSGCFYRRVNESQKDNDGLTNLALHPDQQLRNPAARVYGVKRFHENLGDMRCIRRPRSMRAHRHIKVIEIRKEFGIWSRFQALFREHRLEDLLLRMHKSYRRQYSVY